MSEHTLEYWKKKYKLWRILHGGEYVLRNDRAGVNDTCMTCILRGKGCRNKKTLMFNKKTESISFSKKLGDDDFFCIEWIKYV